MNAPTKPRVPWLLSWGRWAVYVLIFGLFVLKALYWLDPDFGWHLREGQDFLNGIWPTTDQYNFNAADYSWAAHEWLSDILMAGLFNFGGYALVAVVWGLFFTAGFWFAGKGKFGPAVLAAFLACLTFIGVRTVVFAFLGLGFLMWFMNYTWKSDKLKLALVLLIILLWSWLHGSFIIGIIYLIFRAIFVDKSWRLAGAALLGGLLTIIGPFGIELWREILAIMADGNLMWHISEWQPGINFWTITPLFMLWFMNFALNPPARLSRKNWRGWLYFARFDIALFLTSVKSIRNYPLFALSAIDAAHGSLLKLYTTTRPFKAARRLAMGLYIALILGLAYVAGRVYVPIVADMIDKQNVVLAVSGDNGFPNLIVERLKSTPCDGNVFNHYNIGGYLIWQLPESKVYIDGRMGTTWARPSDSELGEAGENYFATWDLINNGERAELSFSDVWFGPSDKDLYQYTEPAKLKQAEVFEKFNITCAIVRDDSKIYSYLQSQNWQTAVSDDNGWYLLTKAL
ncbi:MAG: hypothetical protein LBU20_00185 [Candidatus Nomurabacteria bacterium]|jgi:hypothetical protein|nr:hypothetical protein [Candidatus Nomurabacteria bacterium]